MHDDPKQFLTSAEITMLLQRAWEMFENDGHYRDENLATPAEIDEQRASDFRWLAAREAMRFAAVCAALLGDTTQLEDLADIIRTQPEYDEAPSIEDLV